MTEGRKIRVLIIDDSAIVRRALSEIVSSHPDLEVAGTAADPFVARDKILALRPDVLTLDIEMPRMDGLTFLKKLMRYHPLPVVVISSLGQSSSQAAIEALHAGAVDVVAKPGGPYSVTELRDQLALKIRAAASATLRREKSAAPAGPRPEPVRTAGRAVSLIALGASTGGVEALRTVLTALPAEMPPIVIVQHIPAVFSGEFARRLDQICRVRVREAQDGEAIEAGCALLAPGNFHLTVRGSRGSYRASVHGGERVHYQRPAVDVLFESVAKSAGASAIGVVLTGMGADGAAGLLEMKRAGAHTIAQNEASCVVFGMPREAIRVGAAQEILPLDQIGAELARYATTPWVVREICVDSR
ncbi:MAG TPA: chemotaxis response regulator protein-glutamate methylesterase [Bryobacteraceae bacterium]|nr:chemotaxis response regulator protein-glutamate methylesterase [Bryobacteraceae bacterium]